MDLTIVPYEPRHAREWDEFVSRSKNGTFMLQRGYVDYHADRFRDASLMAYDRNSLVGVLPGNVIDTPTGQILESHGGLTYGGWVTGPAMTLSGALAMFDQMDAHLAARGISRVRYKPVPRVYHQLPADEDEYALFLRCAVKVRHDVSSAVALKMGVRLSSGRRDGLRRARRARLTFSESHDLKSYAALLEDVLGSRHHTRPTHDAEELAMLASRFPEQIHLYVAQDSRGALLAGALVYDCGQTVHTQYLASSEAGRRLGALDLVIITLLQDVYANRTYLNFGISTEEGGKRLNEGLVAQKEGFGARSLTSAIYEYPLQGTAPTIT